MKRKDIISMIFIITYCACVITFLRWSVFQSDASNGNVTTMYAIHNCNKDQDNFVSINMILQPPCLHTDLIENKQSCSNMQDGIFILNAILFQSNAFW